MKTSLVIAALAAALITGSTASSQAIPGRPPQQEHPAEQFLSRRTRRISRVTADFAVIGVSAFTAGTAVSAFTGATGVLAFIGVTGVLASTGATGLSAIMDTAAIGVSAYTGATAGAALACIATAAAGETVYASAYRS